MWTDGKAEVGRAREEKGRKKIGEKTNTKKSKEKMHAKHCVFPQFCGTGRSKSRLAKAARMEPSGCRGNQKLHAAVA